MNLIDFTKRLQGVIADHPDLAQAEMIVRNVQGFDSGTDEPEEENAKEPYWLGCVSDISVDSYLSTEDVTFFLSDYDGDIEGFWHVLDEWQASVLCEDEYYDPTELPDDEVRRRVEALPWERAIIVSIGIA